MRYGAKGQTISIERRDIGSLRSIRSIGSSIYQNEGCGLVFAFMYTMYIEL